MHGSWNSLLKLGFGRILTLLLRKGFRADDVELVHKSRAHLLSRIHDIEQDWIGTVCSVSTTLNANKEKSHQTMLVLLFSSESKNSVSRG